MGGCESMRAFIASKFIPFLMEMNLSLSLSPNPFHKESPMAGYCFGAFLKN
jgi:hypothetical protein